MRTSRITALSIGILILVNFSLGEYVSEDEPPCRDNCYRESLESSEKVECVKEYMEFYSYKMVKSVFNFAKIAVYAGLWNSRNEKPDPQLFERIFQETLQNYNDSSILGNVEYDLLNRTATQLYERLRQWTVKREKNNSVPYESYPILKCPVPCNYELLTWQTLFYVSLAIFVLALFSVLFYSVFLRKQYVSLRNRFKNSKFSKANVGS
ncbi:unnamed protein product [Brachionus calyciflorus]|uniref:Uncharacterized protein n=1 Tax=Brachionus calyciflorus TaxID=104777 RepID=A0A813M389_9BILA|nr:unnamed protein product [Brachionus calyciflorus]